MKKWWCTTILLACGLTGLGVLSSLAYSDADKQALIKALESGDYAAAVTLSEKLLKTDPGDNTLFAIHEAANSKLYETKKTDEPESTFLSYGNNPLPTPDPRRYESFWDGDGVRGKPSISISLRQQIALFFSDDQLVGLAQLSTGREGFNTPKGDFAIIEKDKGHDDGDGTPYIMRLTKRISLRTGYLPGYPASDGDIRMPEFIAEHFFKAVSVGTPVMIKD
jgi:hypothetical protein